MALDEALLEGLVSGASVPTLRFYGWDPPAVSLGHSQRIEDVDLAACDRLGVDVVRRPTGGRGVLHVAELTYSVTSPAGQESVAESYCRISRAIARAIGRLGAQVSLQPGSREAPRSARPADCFALSTAADLVAAGRKIVGSAQVRRRGYLLQHGSIKLEPARIRISDVLADSPANASMATLAELLGRPACTFRDALMELIAEELGGPWGPAPPTEQELERARAIEARNSSSLRRPGPLRLAED